MRPVSKSTSLERGGGVHQNKAPLWRSDCVPWGWAGIYTVSLRPADTGITEQ